MEENKKKSATDNIDKEIVFSQTIKAGKRIYYVDVKRNRKDDMFVAITESKKIFSGEGEDAQVNFEKHKIFLYKEDFEKFIRGLQEAIRFIQERNQHSGQPAVNENSPEKNTEKESLNDLQNAPLNNDIKIDIDF